LGAIGFDVDCEARGACRGRNLTRKKGDYKQINVNANRRKLIVSKLSNVVAKLRSKVAANGGLYVLAA